MVGLGGKGNQGGGERRWVKGRNRVKQHAREDRKWDKGKLPSLKPLLESRSRKLKGDGRVVKDVVDAAWLSRGRLRIVLKEGRKRQVRRMVEEMLGMKVKELRRVRIGGVEIGGLGVGRWRMLSKREGGSLLGIGGGEDGGDGEEEEEEEESNVVEYMKEHEAFVFGDVEYDNGEYDDGVFDGEEEEEESSR